MPDPKSHFATQLNRLLFSFLAVGTLLIAGCATAPAPTLSLSNPANPDATEGQGVPRRDSLRSDATTQKTNDLISKQENASASPDQKQHDDMSKMPGMDMEGMK